MNSDDLPPFSSSSGSQPESDPAPESSSEPGAPVEPADGTMPPVLVETELDPERQLDLDQIVRSHVIWSIGAGLLPIPLVDIAAVTAVQIDLLKQLATLYGVDYSKASGKTFVSAITGSTFAKLGASMLKSIPGVGSALGGVSMSIMSGASTYALAHVVARHLETSGNFLDFDVEWAKKAYHDALEKGKDLAAKLDRETDDEAAKKVHESIGKLAELRDDGVLTDEEYEAKKNALLERL